MDSKTSKLIYNYISVTRGCRETKIDIDGETVIQLISCKI